MCEQFWTRREQEQNGIMSGDLGWVRKCRRLGLGMRSQEQEKSSLEGLGAKEVKFEKSWEENMWLLIHNPCKAEGKSMRGP